MTVEELVVELTNLVVAGEGKRAVVFTTTEKLKNVDQVHVSKNSNTVILIDWN